MLKRYNFFAPSEGTPELVRSAVYTANILSSIFSILALALFVILYSLFGWSKTSIFIILISVIFALIPLINRLNFNVGRLLFCLVPVYIAFGVSLYGKSSFPQQSYIAYFDVRFIILVTTILPAIIFVIEEKWKIAICMGSTLLCLLLFDPVHNAFGLGYFQRGFTARSYYYINYITFISFLVLACGVIVLKVITARAEGLAKKSIDALNESNVQLVLKNKELTKLNESMAEQREKLIRQKREIQESRELLSEANLLISSQQERLIESNKSLEKLVAQKTEDLSSTNEELVRHNNELRQFSYTVSHNLRAPVARLLGLTDLFKRSKPEADREEIAEMIRKSGRELDVILKDLNQIIDLRNDLYQVREKILFEEEWKKTLFVLQEQLRPGYQVQANFQQAPFIYSIRAMIQSILYNLVSNAIKYRNPENDLRIDVTTSRSDQAVILSVKDNGLGINLAAQRENVFKLYRRFHTHVDGKGLGLYLVKTQVDTLGGTIQLESEINRGTNFIVTIPIPPNVSKQVFFESNAAEIYYDADINNTVIVWKRNITGLEYRKAFQTVLHTLKTYNTPGWVADLRLQGVVPIEEQQWFLNTVLPEAVNCGLRRVAAVGFMDPIRRNYFEGMQKKTEQLGLELKVFDELDAAISWMESFIKKV
ncbi:MAG: sensor histidine kinase [Bacteroidetes bacterium CHB5]|nr:sensor histidine kinase [Bacteroidetes bacterium CHB5]